jgi:PAS domain S-box-containing protein
MATILIVDDLSDNRKLLVTLLSHHGHRLLEAADGRAGLAAVHADRPDLVITDVLMPVMDGYELVRQLRLDPATSSIPVVFYTAHYSEREARAMALATGVTGVLRKPAVSADVLAIVSRVLSGASVAAMPDAVPLTTEFDRDHLRLLTDKLSEKAGDLRAANARLRALINIGLELASERDSDRLLENVCVAARDLFGATYVMLGILDSDTQTVQRVVTCGTDAAAWIKAGDAVPGIFGTVVAGRQTLRGDNPGGAPAGLQLPPRHPRIQAYLAAPIVSPARVHGWICLVGNEGRPFSEDDEDLVMALAGQVGRLYEVEHEILERRQAESAAGQSETRKAAILNSVLDCIVTMDAGGVVIEFNAAAERTFGYKRADAIGRRLAELIIPPPVRAAHAAGLERYLATGEGPLIGKLVEVTAMRSDGSEIPVELSITAIRSDKAPIFTGVLRDITSRRQADETRARLAAIVNSSDDAIFSTALDDSILTWNLGAERLYGYKASEVIGRNRALLVPAGRRDELAAILAKALRGEPGEPLETQRARKDGSTIQISLKISPMTDPAGRVIGTSTIARDITSRKKAEADLAHADERMRFALEASGVGIWDMDYTTGVLRWSETLEAQYGLPPRTFDGTFDTFAGLLHPDDRASVLETIEKAMKSGTDFTLLHRAVTPDGTVRWLSGAGRIHLGAGGEPVRGVGISLDVTARRMLEEQYQQAQKMDAIGRLAGGVAHDFNNLLTAILGYCELLLADMDPTDQRHADITEIQKAGESAAALTRQLLAFSRKQIIEPTLLDLNAVVTDMRRLLGRLIREDVTVVLNLGRDLARVKADRGQVEQIVVNLAVNARDAMPRGGTLTIETANEDLDERYAKTHLAVKPGPYVVLTVTDTGSGMTPQVQARLFEPFFTTKEPGKGTGLGLATVHGIVTRSGGTITVHSEFGKGTSFKVYFPQAAEELAAAEAPPPVVRQSVGGETVLVVEHEEGILPLASRMLEREGYTVLSASNAEEALRLFDQHTVDVLLTDVVMPGDSGPELTRKLVERLPGLKVIYMSGYTEAAIVEQGVLKQGIAFLHKPFTSETLGRKIREVLDR